MNDDDKKYIDLSEFVTQITIPESFLEHLGQSQSFTITGHWDHSQECPLCHLRFALRADELLPHITIPDEYFSDGSPLQIPICDACALTHLNPLP